MYFWYYFVFRCALYQPSVGNLQDVKIDICLLISSNTSPNKSLFGHKNPNPETNYKSFPDIKYKYVDSGTTFFMHYEGVSINNQPIPFPMDRDGHDFHALFQNKFYTWVQNYTRIESFFNKILNVKHD